MLPHISKLNTLLGRLFIWIITGLIKLYRLFLSPLLGNNCRFYPSCSSYALESFQRFPLRRALWLSIKRIFKCQPFSKGGLDSVPKYHG